MTDDAKDRLRAPEFSPPSYVVYPCSRCYGDGCEYFADGPDYCMGCGGSGDDYVDYAPRAANIAFALACVACLAACDVGPHDRPYVVTRHTFIADNEDCPGKRALSCAGLWKERM